MPFGDCRREPGVKRSSLNAAMMAALVSLMLHKSHAALWQPAALGTAPATVSA